MGALAPGQLPDPVLEAAAGPHEDVVGAGVPRCRHLLVAGDEADHRGAAGLGHLRQQEAHATRRSVHHSRVAGLDPVGLRDHVVCRDPLQHHRGRRLVGDALGDLHQ
jgi:hypothetical protein